MIRNNITIRLALTLAVSVAILLSKPMVAQSADIKNILTPVPATETAVVESSMSESVTSQASVDDSDTMETPVTEPAALGSSIAEPASAEDSVTESVTIETPVTEPVALEAPINETLITETTDFDTVTAASEFLIDISNWKCEDCAFEEGYSSEVELGLGQVSDSSSKFGEYNGLNEETSLVILNAKVRYQDQRAHFLNMSAQDLGLDSRSLQLEAGRQGNYKVFFHYDEIAHAYSDSIMTPYLGNGGANLILPTGWVASGTTPSMTQLANSRQNYDVKLQRKRMDVGFLYTQASSWKYNFNYRHDIREGAKPSAGSFFFNAAQLIEPVDYVTDELDASVSYIGKHGQARLAYYGSFFSNENKSLSWQEAFNPIFTGANSGQRALPPDNLFQQLILSGGYQLTDKTRISSNFSVGRMQQDDDFLPVTTNSSLSVPALPRSSADAQVNTLHGNIRVISSISDKFRIKAAYNYAEHDNQTPQSMYTWVSTDAFVNTPQSNQAYSFTHQTFKVAGNYRVSATSKLSAGVDFDRLERSQQEVDKTEETTHWGKLDLRGMNYMDMTFKLTQAERDVSNYQLVAAGTSASQNPLLKKYNMADRSRSTVGAHFYSISHETFNVGLSIDYAEDDYSTSTIGLIDGKQRNVNADASVILTEQSSMHAFAGQERIESTQNGSQSFSVASWSASNEDTVNTLGLGYKHRLMEDQLDLGVDYVISKSLGKIQISSASSEDFPDLEVDLQSIKLYADYRMQENLSVHSAYWYEDYETKNWALDGVSYDSIWNLLGFGETSPAYKVSVFSVSLRYKF